MEVSSIPIQVKVLPEKPGVYQYYDKEGELLYIGKAKNLKQRVSSYFNRTHDRKRTNILVSRIHKILHIVVATETDALLLENNLIKEYQPRFNILLKDDKNYPWICIKKEAFPRVFVTRQVIKDGSEYFGPYTNYKTIDILMDLIKSLYSLRTCSYDLSPNQINTQKYKVCLEYHIKNCLGACEAYQTSEDYNTQIQSIRQLLKGNLKDALEQFTAKMEYYASILAFEKAQEIKEKIEILVKYQSRSTIVHPTITNVDVFTVVSDQDMAYVNYLQIIHGRVLRSHTTEVQKRLEETDQQILEYAILQLRERFNSLATEIYVPFKVSLDHTFAKISIPKLGDKKKILDLSIRNAKYFRQDRFKKLKVVDPDSYKNNVLSKLQKDLRLKELPVHIECFDNSNIQGVHPVAACVVFKNAKPSKKDYRKFQIKTVEGPDDFASMREIVYRRYKRLLDQNDPLPQLIVIDGGKGQLGAALEALEELSLRGKIPIIGIAKRLEEIFFPQDSYPLYLNKRSTSLKLIQQLRNEAHRFGITFHRDKRSAAALDTQLDHIKGIGLKTQTLLLLHFKSIAMLKKASLSDIVKVIGKHKGGKVYQFFHPNKLAKISDKI